MAPSDRPPAKAPAGTVWNDPKTPGLYLLFGATKSAWYLYYRNKARQQRRWRIADLSVMNLTDARDRARKALVYISEGGDPHAERRSAPDVRPTVTELMALHLQHADTKNKGTTRYHAELAWKKHVLPKLGEDTAVADVTEADITKLHNGMASVPVAANRVAALLHKAFNLAESNGWRPRNSNPVHVERYPEKKRRRVPEADEPVRLLKAMEAMRAEQPHFVALIELQALCGTRNSEIRNARWEWVKDDGLHLPDTKTGERIIPLSSFAREVLAEVPRISGNPFVIAGSQDGQPIRSYAKRWRALLDKAGIANLWTHDLRRFFASSGLSKGVSLSAVGELLGHTQAQTTKRYAYLLTGAATELAETTAAEVHRRMRGEKPAGDAKAFRPKRKLKLKPIVRRPRK